MINTYSLKFTQPLIERDFQEGRRKQDLKEFNSFYYLCIINASSKIIYGFMLGQFMYTGFVAAYFLAIFMLRMTVRQGWLSLSYILIFIQFGLLILYNIGSLLQEDIVDCKCQWLHGFEACIMHTYVYLQGTNFLAQTVALTIVYVEYLLRLQLYSPELINLQAGFFLLIIGVISMRYQFELNKRQQYLEIISNQKWLNVVELVQNQWTILVKFDQQEQLAIQKSTSQMLKQLQKIEDDVEFRTLLREFQLDDSKTQPVKQHRRKMNLEMLTREKLLSDSQSPYDNSCYDQYDFYHPQSKQTYQVTIMDFFYDCEKRVLLIVKEDTYQQSKQKLKLKLIFYKQIILSQTIQTSYICNKLIHLCNEKPKILLHGSLTMVREAIKAIFNLNNIRCWLNDNATDVANATIIDKTLLEKMLKPSECNKVAFQSHISFRTNVHCLQLMLFNMIYLVHTIFQIKPQGIQIAFQQGENDVCRYLNIKFEVDKSEDEQFSFKLIKLIRRIIPYPNDNVGNHQNSSERYFGMLFYRNLKKSYKCFNNMPQAQSESINLAFALTVTKYLLTTYGTNNAISFEQLINGHTTFEIQLIQISNHQEAGEYNQSNDFIPQNRSIFATLCQIRQGLLY